MEDIIPDERMREQAVEELGSIIAALCCFTPVLVILLGAEGLSYAVGYIDTEMLLAVGAQRILPWLGTGRNIRIFNRISGGTFIGAGVLLATVERN